MAKKVVVPIKKIGKVEEDGSRAYTGGVVRDAETKKLRGVAKSRKRK